MFSRIKQSIKSQFTVCPKTGRITGLKKGKRTSMVLWIILGVASVVWVVIRVVPKPSRAEYPCQKFAQPIAAGFVAWLMGLLGSTLLMRKARSMFQRKRFMIGAISFFVGAVICFITLNSTQKVAASVESLAAFTPSDAANSPMGTAIGVQPGRVAWVYDGDLTKSNISSGYWWDDNNTDTDVALKMMTQAILNIAGDSDIGHAWDTIFKSFNQRVYEETNTGYQAGDKIAIKINNISSRSYEWGSGDNLNCPQLIYALTWHLVNIAGVPDEDIAFYDCIWYHGDPVYDKVHDAFPGVRFAEGDGTDRSGYEDGPGDDPGTREMVVRDPDCVVHYADTNTVHGSGRVCLPTVVSEAKYFMSLTKVNSHALAGVTLCAKNMFGSVWQPDVEYTDGYYHNWSPKCMHETVAAYDYSADLTMRDMGTYNALVDLMGHEDLGGKSVLLIGDCIRRSWWSAAPFNGGPASSIFVSQDFCAIESVMLDFLNAAGKLNTGTHDNYLHEASQADDPPSGTFYDPEGDGTRLKSLGVHEHWNNSSDKQYSRNLGTGDGIELTQLIDQSLSILYATQNEQTVDITSGSVSIDILSTVSWSVSEDADWLTATKNSNSKLTLTFEANESAKRTVTVALTADGVETVYVTLTQTGDGSNIDNTLAGDNIVSVYPSPATDNLFIASDANINAGLTVKFYNTAGKLVQSNDYLQIYQNSPIEVDISSLDNGVYFMRLNSSEFTQTEKIIKE